MIPRRDRSSSPSPPPPSPSPPPSVHVVGRSASRSGSRGGASPPVPVDETRRREEEGENGHEYTMSVDVAQVLLPHISWCLGQPPDTAKRWNTATRELEPLTDYELQEVLFSEPVWLRLPGGTTLHLVPDYALGGVFVTLRLLLRRLNEYFWKVEEGIPDTFEDDVTPLGNYEYFDGLMSAGRHPIDQSPVYRVRFATFDDPHEHVRPLASYQRSPPR